MKKYILSFLFTLLLVSGVFASPFLGVDPDVNHNEYLIEINGATYGPFLPIEDRGDTVIIFDFNGMLVRGETYVVRAMSYNAFGDASEWSVPLEFASGGGTIVIIRQTPDAPVLRLLSE
jgi:hypothetical protein